MEIDEFTDVTYEVDARLAPVADRDQSTETLVQRRDRAHRRRRADGF